MTLISRHPVMRAVAALWLLAALVILLVTLLRPEVQADERAGLASLVPLYFLSFPLGHAGVMAIGRLKVELYTAHDFALGIGPEAMLLWAALTVLGVLQWFVLLPWIARKTRALVDFLFTRFIAR